MLNHSSRPAIKCSVVAIHSALAALGALALAAPVQAQTGDATAVPVPAQAEAIVESTPATPAPAQSGAAVPAQGTMQSVVVSASRIDRAGYSAPTPTTTIGAATLEQRAIVNVGDLLNEVPAFRASSTPAAGGIGNNGSILAEPARPDSGAHHGAAEPRTPAEDDLSRTPAPAARPISSIIPTGMLRNVDVVTGGASAAYGSDAVAGVVNMVIDETMEGIKATVQGGQTRYHDARDGFLSLAGGTDRSQAARVISWPAPSMTTMAAPTSSTPRAPGAPTAGTCWRYRIRVRRACRPT
jgi:iron complex outermembrane receptor protein